MYTLIIAEKPTAARRIAYALSDGDVKQTKENGVSYFRLKHNGKDIIVVSAAGHLFVLDEKEKTKKWTYPVFEVEWKPTFTDKKNTWSKKFYKVIEKLSKNADEFISACDYDIEGSTIAYNILRFICGVNDGRRMKFSTLTKHDLLEAYKNASEHLDFPQIEAGLARHTLDFLWGINLSRALTLALEKAGGYWTLSIGRVQGPTLKILVDRERAIESFVPELFWEVILQGTINGQSIEAIHISEKFWEKTDAEKTVEKCRGKKAFVESVEKKIIRQPPPTPFDLTTMQREAYKNFGYSPKMTLDIAQSLYEQALISYPRTSSQKLPKKLGLKDIVKRLSEQNEYSRLCRMLIEKDRFVPREGKKEDPAHPAIFPTGNKPQKLTKYQKNIYDLIVRRFLSTFAEPAVRESVSVIIDINGEKFKTSGITTLEAKWLEFYGKYAKLKEQMLPKIEKGQTVDNPEISMNEKETSPPNRYSQASIIKTMEDLGLGTKATRAQILQTLYDREYIKDKSIKVTPLGKAVATTLENHCPEIISPELTKEFEKNMELIQMGKKQKEEIIEFAKEKLKTILDEFKKHELHIGSELKEGVKIFKEEESFIGVCPKCGNELRIIQSSSTRKRFVGCSNYPKCDVSFPLPQKGMLRVLNDVCPKCGLRLVEIKQFKKRPWKLCVKCGFVNNKNNDSKNKAKKS
ncbi:MAG: DNA topoisomerase I [Candidatus Aenigmarchaeota archaeon]|nr:DNA topoisomerase I [Candidatus Aenigmarchaeota archaeon]